MDTAVFELVVSSRPILYRAELVKMVILNEVTRIGGSRSDEGPCEWWYESKTPMVRANVDGRGLSPAAGVREKGALDKVRGSGKVGVPL